MEDAFLHPMAGTVCAGGAAYWTRTDDGLRVRIAVWRNEASENGSVLVFPGRTDYIEQFTHTVGEFQRRGYASLIIDWRGHGLSDRVAHNPRAGHVVQFADYQKDVSAMIRAAFELNLPKPWYLLAHSMGGCIALRALVEGLPVSACAFTAPMWDIELSSVLRFIAFPITFVAQALGMAEAYAPGHSGDTKVLKIDFEANSMTNDPDRYAYLVQLAKEFPAAQTGGPSMGWLRQALLEARLLEKHASPNVPCITFCGEDESTVDANVIRSRMANWPNGSLVTLPRAKHELLMEVPAIRNALMDEICALFASVKDASQTFEVT